MGTENQACDTARALEIRPVSDPDTRNDSQPGTQSAQPWIDVLKRAVEHGLIDPTKAPDLIGAAEAGVASPNTLQEKIASLLVDGDASDKALDSLTIALVAGDVIELRAVDPDGGGAWSLCGRLDVPEERKPLRDFVCEHIGRNNLYFGINPRRSEMAGANHAGSALDVVARRMVVLDMDLKDAPDVDPEWSRTRQALRALCPILELNSGNGLHFWFRIDDVEGPDLPGSAGPLADAMARVGADNMADPPRIARVPYTVNLPNKSKRRRGNVVRLAFPVQG